MHVADAPDVFAGGTVIIIEQLHLNIARDFIPKSNCLWSEFYSLNPPIRFFRAGRFVIDAILDECERQQGERDSSMPAGVSLLKAHDFDFEPQSALA